MVTMKITWPSAEAKTSGDGFLQERRAAVEAFVSAEKIVLPIYNPPGNTAVIKFRSQADADEYKALLEGLALKYGKGALVFDVS